jgi:hypothetical protein
MLTSAEAFHAGLRIRLSNGLYAPLAVFLSLFCQSGVSCEMGDVKLQNKREESMTKARRATPTVTFVDEYAERYQDLFSDVRSAGSVQVSAGGYVVRAQTQDTSCDCQGGWSRCASAASRSRLRTLVGASSAQEASDLITASIERKEIRVVHS